MRPTWASPSPGSTATSASSPEPMAPTTAPSTSTRARVTRWISAITPSLPARPSIIGVAATLPRMTPHRESRLARLLGGLLAAAGRLPLGWLQRLGRAGGWLAGALGSRAARVAARNLALCFPELPAKERARLRRDALAATAQTALECARLWTRPATENVALVREVHGLPLFEQALAAPAGLIVAAPHLGNWELLNQWLASRTPLTIVYRAPRQPVLEGVLRRGRGVPGVTQLRAEPGAVRGLLRTLQGGGVLGILPDQQPKQGEGVFAPFFGVPALTMTLLPRLAQRTGATVLFAFAARRG